MASQAKSKAGSRMSDNGEAVVETGAAGSSGQGAVLCCAASQDDKRRFHVQFSKIEGGIWNFAVKKWQVFEEIEMFN